jgi:putative ABC transport system permease protein
MRPARSLLRAPAFSIAAVLALGIGIGASAALFSVIDGVLLRPLPYRAQEDLVLVDAKKGGKHTIPSYQQFLDWRARARSFEDMAYAAGEAFLLRGAHGTEAIAIAAPSEGFFELLGTRPVIGRLPSSDEESAAAAPRVILISQRLWRASFGGDSTVLGRTIATDKGSFTVIGVMPAGFAFPSWASAWTPLAPVADLLPALKKRDWRADARAIGRLKRGVTPTAAMRDLGAVAQELGREHPATDADTEALLTPIVAEVVGDVRRPLVLFALAVGLLLVIACANVGTLALVRGSARARELAVRSALGASRWRIARLLLSESALLSFAGAVVGLVLAWWMVNIVRIASPSGLPRLEEIALDWRAVAFTVGLAILTPFIFGLLPALHASRVSVARFGRVRSDRRSDSRLRSGLLVAQVALSLVLLVCAGLLIRSFALLRAVDPGFEPQRLVGARVQPPISRYQSAEALVAVYERVRSEIRRLPGVERVAIVNHQDDAGVRTNVRIPGQVADRGAEARALYRVAGAEYFEAVGQRVLRGRGFGEGDMTPSSRAAVISASLAKQLWPERDPIGKYVTVWKQVPARPDYNQPVDMEVVGVVADAVFQSPGGPAIAAIYLPFPVSPTDQASFIVRTGGRPSALIPAIRRAIVAVDRDIPTNRIGALTEGTWASLIHRFDLVLLIAFAVAALSLATVGLYGVVAYVIVQRRHEIGVRRAIGATEAQLKRSFVANGVRLAGVGVAIGIPLAVAAGRLLRASLYGVGAFDPATVVAVALLLVGAAAVAAYLPARRLSEISPLEALRAE